jgi:hypothetical protein
MWSRDRCEQTGDVGGAVEMPASRIAAGRVPVAASAKTLINAIRTIRTMGHGSSTSAGVRIRRSAALPSCVFGAYWAPP